MKYCVPYFKHFKYNAEISEVIIPYDEQDINFIQRVLEIDYLKEKTLVIEVLDAAAFIENNRIVLFNKLISKEYNIKLRFEDYNENYKDFYKQLKTDNVQFFFKEYVRNWDFFHGLIETGVSDIYIVESLGFELNLLGPVAHVSDVSLRVFANVLQNGWDDNASVKSFFIRPEDVAVYAPYVDIIEFIGATKEYQETMVKIYAIRQKWVGDLNELILGLRDSIPNKSIIPAVFGDVRVRCGKKCLKGSKCNICNAVVNTAHSLDEKDLIFR